MNVSSFLAICPHCAKAAEFPEHLRGREVRCSACHVVFAGIPARIPEPTVVSQNRKTWVVAASLVVVGIIGGTVATLAWNRRAENPRPTTQADASPDLVVADRTQQLEQDLAAERARANRLTNELQAAQAKQPNVPAAPIPGKPPTHDIVEVQLNHVDDLWFAYRTNQLAADKLYPNKVIEFYANGFIRKDKIGPYISVELFPQEVMVIGPRGNLSNRDQRHLAPQFPTSVLCRLHPLAIDAFAQRKGGYRIRGVCKGRHEVQAAWEGYIVEITDCVPVPAK